MCNECGNCKSFCPWDSAPYLDKFTLFANEADMENSKNQGFTVLDAAAGVCRVRLQGRIMDYTVGTVNADVPDGIQNIIRTVINDYSYTVSYTHLLACRHTAVKGYGTGISNCAAAWRCEEYLGNSNSAAA